MIERSAGKERWLGVRALIQLMAAFGVSEAAVRQALSRMARQGWLDTTKRGNRAYYAVTSRGRRRIEELSPRIYGPVVEWDGLWRVLSYTIDEGHRERRDRLRKELSVLGWAPLAASTWISPADSLRAARAAAEGAGVAGAVHFFAAEYRGPLSDRELLHACWDIEAIAAAYRDFIERYEPRVARIRSADGAIDEERAFVDRLWLVHDYRKFAYLDPGLPSELLPAHWPGTRAAALFREYHAALLGPSTRYFRRCVDAAGAADGPVGARVEPATPCPKSP
ncbi:MAG: GntR family transcriptional regulator [Candidatus Eremiobacteraeota bacterium]|nr:GntR family transcriptional regulator [Candidatus Eremiobacteraeota bacterium]